MLFLYNRRGARKAATRVVDLLLGSLAKPFLSDARQPEVGFLASLGSGFTHLLMTDGKRDIREA